jgi:hypothetical protein
MQPPRESQTAVTGDAWIGQLRQPQGSQKLLSRVTPGFDSQTAPRDSETAVTGDALIRQPPRESETAVTRDAWIRQPHSPLGSQKLLSRVTRGFESQDSPLGSLKLQSRVTRRFYS